MEIKCPSGLAGNIRKLKTREANILTDVKANRRGTVADELLKGVWVETTNPGPYEVEDGKLNWGSVLASDRFYALMMARIHTYGADYSFKVRCQHCAHTIEWLLDLTDLDVKPVSEEDLSRFRAGNQFTKVVNSHTVTFHLMTGDAERRAQVALKQNPDDRMVTALRTRIDEVRGLKGIEVKKFIADLDLDEAMELVDEFAERDGGVKSNITIECDECLAEQDVDVPFDRGAFWTPPRRSRQA